MGAFEKVQQIAEATPAPANWGIMLGSVIVSFLQPIAIVITVAWGSLQIHSWVKREWGRDFLWLDRIFKKSK